jgi:hypothetical protein
MGWFGMPVLANRAGGSRIRTFGPPHHHAGREVRARVSSRGSVRDN